jgi:hypothetical protein
MTRLRLKYVHEFRDRHGKVRRYFRRPGLKKIALPGLPGSDEFMAAYQAALGGIERPQIGASRTKPGTVNAAIIGYYTSLAFRSLAPSSQHKRRLILGTLSREAWRQEHYHAAAEFHQTHAGPDGAVCCPQLAQGTARAPGVCRRSGISN